MTAVSIFKVLVVDDSTTLRKLIEIAMRGTGCEVSFAATGAEAVSKSLDLVPDVILLDYILPDLKSVDVCKQLAASSITAGIPVVLMSANQRSILDEFRQYASVVDFIGKPFTALEIKTRLQAARRQRTAREAPVNALGMAARAPAQPSPVQRRPEPGVHRPLQLAGSLAATPLLDVIKLLAAAAATGVLSIEMPGVAGAIRVSLRRGEVLLATRSQVDWNALGKAVTDAVTPQLRAQIVKNQETGRPAAVTLVEVGLTKMANQPLELQTASGIVLNELMAATIGDYTWQNLPILPDYVEAFGRHISIASLALGHLRGHSDDVSHAALVDQVFERSARFSQKLASAKLNSEEQRVLGQVDGNSDARFIAARSKVSLERACSILARLVAADLIVANKGSLSSSSRTLAILDTDRENFIAPLQVWLGQRAAQVELIELDGAQSLLAAAKRIRPNLIIVGDTGLMNEFIYKDLPQITSDGATVVVALLGTANASRARELIQAGFHSVLSKPVHFDDLERVLAL
jgi:CheY-like chemotaxis protein